MKIELLYSSPLWLASHACRMSHDNHDKSDTDMFNAPDHLYEAGPKDKALIERVGNKYKHQSILEMLTYVFDVEMSCKTLLAFSRHRIGISLTMRSTRYTTKKNKDKHQVQDTPKTEQYLQKIMDVVSEAIKEGLSNDEISLLLPQAYIYRGQIQFNGRSLQHFLSLRTKKDAHFQIRDLAQAIYNEIPSEHKYLYVEYMKGE